MSTSPEISLCQTLDRLGPSIFAGVLDSGGVLRYANRSALSAIGSTADQVLGQSFATTPWWQACEVSRQRLRQALAGALQGEESRFDVRVASTGGATLSMDFSLSPLLGPDGRVNWLVPSARDVSDRQIAKYELKVTRNAVELARDALLQVDADGSLRDANAAACHLLGMEREQLLRQRMTDLATYKDAKTWSHRWSELCKQGDLRFETGVRHYLGYEIPVDVSARLAAGAEGSYVQLCIRDLRERHAADFRLRQCAVELRDVVALLHEQIALREHAEHALKMHLDNGDPSR